MNNELQQLKALAMAASHGPWRHTGDEYTDRGCQYQGIESPVEIIIGEYGVTKANAKYIAWADPTRILALIARIESLSADAERYKWLLDNYAFGDGYRDIDAALNDGEADKYLSPAIDAAIAKEKA